MKENQKIPSGEGVSEYIEKKSRFIGSLFPVETTEQAVEKIKELQKKYWDASHNCYAYVLGSDSDMRFSDDGEPQGTAGMPILEVLKKQQLFGVLVVVTRYFGGTLLGAGGLIRAYGKATTSAVENAGVSILTPYNIVELNIPYNLLTTVRNLYEQFQVTGEQAEYGGDIKLSLQMPKSSYSGFNNKVIQATSALAVPRVVNEQLIPKKI